MSERNSPYYYFSLCIHRSDPLCEWQNIGEMMPVSKSQYCVSWNSYKNSITKGFCSLQKNSEFVDMTLAAEGNFVKVHQNIVALASPYLKQILQSAPCNHPIIFLTNISHNVLDYLLEYIYVGEVMIPRDEVNTFIEACKKLQISGVHNFILPKDVPRNAKESLYDIPAKPPDNYAAHITINAQNQLEVNAMKNDYHQENLVPATVSNVGDMDFNQSCPKDNDNVYHVTPIIIDMCNNENINCDPPNVSLNTEFNGLQQNMILDEGDNENSICNPINVPSNTDFKSLRQNKIEKNKTQKKKLKPSLPGMSLATDKKCKDGIQQYSISNRGSVQLLLNRYMYHCHHHSHEGRKRRWRCIEYRKSRCPAFVDTDGETIINRAEVHSHHYHDNKILKKFKEKLVFTSTSLSIAEEKNKTINKKETYQNLNEEEDDIQI